ncbi:MAG TPA: M13 family metallopeptidase [Rhizomicrobium sp.]|jgi:putative endopeptidase|nr:M13 family metallopeptidase [Rhizomicrobium sp.]
MKRRIVLLGTVLLATAGVALAGAPAIKPWGVELNYIDPSVKPGDDFFAYANGNWLKHDVIPADRTYSGVNLELDLQNEAKLKGLVADLAKTPDDKLSPEGRKLRDLYNAFMDTRQIEAAGLTPAQADLKSIAGLATLRDVARAMGDQALSLDGPFGVYIGIDDKNSDIYSINLYQSGLGMPDRDYYLKTDKDIGATQAAYKKYLASMLGIAGAADVGARAEKIYALELALAKASWAVADRRDTDKVYNPMTIADLKAFAPGFDWDAMFGAAGISEKGGARKVIVAEKSAFPNLAKIFAATPVAVWRDYLTVRYLHHWASDLPRNVDDTDFAFYGTALNGKTVQLERATRGVTMLDNQMGEALGKLYVARYFPPEAKAKALQLVKNLIAAYDADIRTLAWMTPATRAKALEKLHAMVVKIGYPDHFRDYSALSIDRGDVLKSVKAATLFEWRRQMARIDGPTDRMEWGMTPPTNNAENNPNFNQVEFPAGILQPPFFDPNADDAVNYAEIGSTIGHEISHSFDDQGAKYNPHGVVANWFTPADLKAFQARGDAIAAQYSRYEPLPGLHINGRLTLGENIADIAGLVIALKAYHIALGGKPAPVLNGLTGDQRFFIAFARVWRERHRDGALRSQVLSDPHSPSEFRVNGVVPNLGEWYAAFNVKPGDRLYLPPAKRVPVW